MLNRSLIGKKYPPVVFNVKKQRLKFFVKATGQTDPLYFDETYAVDQGHPSLLTPPTFLTTVAMEQENPYQYLEDLNIKMGRLLHARQMYSYHEPVYAGDTITMDSEIADMYDKKEGILQFVVIKSHFTNQKQNKVAEASSTLVVR
jgi:acyl dehydratase